MTYFNVYTLTNSAGTTVIPLFPSVAKPGATVNRREAECHVADQYLLSATDDQIAVSRYVASDCTIMFSGMSTDTRYAAMLEGLKFVGFPRRRANLTFGLIYWTSLGVRDIGLDPDTLRAYTSYPTQWYWKPPENYTRDTVHTLCARNGLGDRVVYGASITLDINQCTSADVLDLNQNANTDGYSI